VGDDVYGQSFLQADKLAVAQMNANLSEAGNKIQFNIVSPDDAGLPATSDSVLSIMYATYVIHVLIGPLTSAEVTEFSRLLTRIT
jgi:ABC-type branched-subunit amino acid transport system substrate-binding protein